ncbi:MAG: RraA family protein [Acidobacteria bacterium]|nr:RraA family protein [Acidobacteriota bacterium]
MPSPALPTSEPALIPTAVLADACVRLGLPLRAAPLGIRGVIRGLPLAGRVLPVRHSGSVDIFLEAMEAALPGDLLVVDNGGRTDEGAVGDLSALEARAAGLAGILVWGCHRDTAELRRMRFPVFSYGSVPTGPLRADPSPPDALRAAHFGAFTVTREDFAVCDEDGVLFVPRESLGELLPVAQEILLRERGLAQRVLEGHSLREQLAFGAYLERRAVEPGYTFRQHLRAIGGAIEE